MAHQELLVSIAALRCQRHHPTYEFIGICSLIYHQLYKLQLQGTMPWELPVGSGQIRTNSFE